MTEPRRNGWIRLAIPASLLAPLLAGAAWWYTSGAPAAPREPDPVHAALLRQSQAQTDLLAIVCRQLARTDLDRAECSAIARAARGVYP